MKLKVGRPQEAAPDTLWAGVHRELAKIISDCEIVAKGESICLTYIGNATILRRQVIKMDNLLDQIEEIQHEGFSK